MRDHRTWHIQCPDKPADQSKVTFPAGDSGYLLNDNQEQQRKNRLVASGIPVTSIASEFEAAIKISNDQTALFYEGRFLEVNSFQGSRSSDTRALVASIAINGAGAKDGEPTLSSNKIEEAGR